MADFASDDLLALAVLRYRQDVLRNRMRGAEGNATAADLELQAIADAVFATVKASTMHFGIGWPMPAPYNESWPSQLLQRALELFNWKTLAGTEAVSPEQVRIGVAAEAYFGRLAQGGEPLGIGGPGDAGERKAYAARDREGSSLIGQKDRRNVLEGFDPAWDRMTR